MGTVNIFSISQKINEIQHQTPQKFRTESTDRQNHKKIVQSIRINT